MTIIDRRELAFDARALIHVIAGSLNRAQAIGLPALRPTGIVFDPEGHRIRIVYEPQAHPEVALAAEHVGAMLVSYCIRARIPIARLADKDVRIEAGSVVLAFSTRLADPTTTG
jgi:hypothetical protein